MTTRAAKPRLVGVDPGFTTIDDALRELRAGKMVMVVTIPNACAVPER